MEMSLSGVVIVGTIITIVRRSMDHSGRVVMSSSAFFSGGGGTASRGTYVLLFLMGTGARPAATGLASTLLPPS